MVLIRRKEFLLSGPGYIITTLLPASFFRFALYGFGKDELAAIELLGGFFFIY